MIRTFLASVFLILAAAADDAERAPVEPESLPAPDQKVAEHQPAIERLEDGRLRLDTIAFDPKTREIRFPAEVNMDEGLLEFLIVHKMGKIHEALLSTDTSPFKLNVVLKLLRYIPSPELYYKTDTDGSLIGEFQEATPEQKAGSRVKLEIEWKDGEKLQRVPITEWISHAVTEKEMPEAPWVYGGSFIADGKFVAEESGDIAAIYLSNVALINYSGRDNSNDDVWLPFPKRVPKVGTPVTVIITPQKTNPEKP